MSKLVIDTSDLTSVADAIREKGGTSATLNFPDGMVSAIRNIPMKSMRISKVVDITTASNLLTIPISGINTVQSIHVCLIDDDVYDGLRVQVYNYADCSPTIRCTTVSNNDYNSNERVSELHGNSSSYTMTTLYPTYITIQTKAYTFGNFYGRYACEVFGS